MMSVIRVIIFLVFLFSSFNANSNLFENCKNRADDIQVACNDFKKARTLLQAEMPMISLLGIASDFEGKYCNDIDLAGNGGYSCNSLEEHLCRDYSEAKYYLEEFSSSCPACANEIPHVNIQIDRFCYECDSRNYPSNIDLNSAMDDLRQHATSREGNVDRFYVDKNGLVTIGIGKLVDNGSLLKKIKKLNQENKPEKTIKEAIKKYNTATEKKAKNFIRKYIKGFKINGRQARFTEVFSEWKNLRDKGIPRKSRGKIKFTDSQKLYNDTIDNFMRSLYRIRPLSKCLNPHIQMAIIDARFNPSGVNPFTHQDLDQMWDKILNPQSRDYDPCGALDIFENINAWKNHDSASYKRRHQQRVDMFSRGLSETNISCH